MRLSSVLRRGGACFSAWLLVSCSSSDVSFVESQPGVWEPDPGAPLAPYAVSEDAAWVFAEDQVRTYELQLAEQDWERLRAHARDEEYVRARLRVEGQAVGVVGLRFKGDHGTLSRCADNAGNLLCSKLSMKIRFDEFAPARRFYGLKRLNFNSMLSDASHLHEQLAYRLFREMGVVAPRAVHARLVVNREDLGVFSLVENIDGRFTDDRFEGGDGNLYKEQWPNTSDPERLEQHLATNEGGGADHTPLIRFAESLASAAPADLPAVLERHMDVDNLFAFFVVDRAVSNWDGPTAFYCRGGCGNHNYYFYQHEAESRFTLIPWDLDNTFKVSTSFDYVPSVVSIPEDCSIRYPVLGDLTAMAPACDPLIGGLARSSRSRYEAQLRRLLDGPYELSALESWIDARAEQLLPHVERDEHGPGVTAFRAELATLRREVELLGLKLQADLAGEAINLLRLDVDAKNDFEGATVVGAKLGVLGRAAASTRYDIALGKETKLGGARHVELSFEFHDDAEPNEQWVRFTLPFNSPDAYDLKRKSALRLMIQTDGPRTVRLSINSSGYTEYLTRPTFGWDVTLQGGPRVVELSLATATMPEWARDRPDELNRVLEYTKGIFVDPIVRGVRSDGYLGRGRVDRGRVWIDDIEFLP